MLSVSPVCLEIINQNETKYTTSSLKPVRCIVSCQASGLASSRKRAPFLFNSLEVEMGVADFGNHRLRSFCVGNGLDSTLLPSIIKYKHEWDSLLERFIGSGLSRFINLRKRVKKGSVLL